MIAPEMPSRTRVTTTQIIVIVPVQKAFSLFTRRSNNRPIHGLRLSACRGGNLYVCWTRMGARGHPGNSALPRICCCIADQQLRFVCGSAFYDRYVACHELGTTVT